MGHGGAGIFPLHYAILLPRVCPLGPSYLPSSLPPSRLPSHELSLSRSSLICCPQYSSSTRRNASPDTRRPSFPPFLGVKVLGLAPVPAFIFSSCAVCQARAASTDLRRLSVSAASFRAATASSSSLSLKGREWEEGKG